MCFEEKFKSISSQEDTRNPTTHKKVVFYTPVQKKTQNRYFTPDRIREKSKRNKNKKPNSFHQSSKGLSSSMYDQFKFRYQLQVQKIRCLSSSRYEQAKYVNNLLQVLADKQAKHVIKNLTKNHKKQRKQIKNAYNQQLYKFQNIWDQYFMGLRSQQQMAIIEFKKSQQRDIQIVQNNLIKRCKSFKINKNELRSIQKKQNHLRRQQKYEQLVFLNKQKKRVKRKIADDQQKKIYSWAKQQQEFLKTYHTKKYITLVSRIEENHNDHFMRYQKQGVRLRQKYHNVLQKLDHEQKVETNLTVQKYPNAKNYYLKSAKKERSFTLQC